MKVKFLQIIINKWLNVNNYKRIIFSIFLIFVGALVAFYVKPKLMQKILKFLVVAKPGHYVRKRHETQIRFKYKLYLWNVTNPSEVAAGTEKPKLEEIGPYVFHEFKQKVNSADNRYEDSVSFNYLSTYTFSPQLSAPLTGNEVVTLLNTVLTSGIVKIQLETPHLLGVLIEAMDIIFKKPSSIFVTMTAMEFIDNGIEIDCNQTAYAAKLVCNEIRKANLLTVMNDEEKLFRFRWFDSIKNDSIQARLTIKRGSKNIQDVGRVIAVNDGPLNVFKQDERCNVINGTDMMFFPPYQRRDDVIWGFSDAACKSFPLRFKYKKTIHGIRSSYKYLDFSDPLLNPACECNKLSGCAVSGTIDLYQCLNVFVSVSAPHYYSAESSIRDTIDGMDPKENLHETGMFIDLQTSVPIIASTRIQVNVLLKQVPEYRIFSRIAGDVWMPQLWFEEIFEIEKADLAKIIIGKVLQVLVFGMGCASMTVGITGCAVTIVLTVQQHCVRRRVSVKSTTESQAYQLNDTN